VSLADPIRFSNLKRMAESPAHYRHACESQFVASRAMRLGTIVHALTFGTDLVVYDGTRRGKAWDEFESAHQGAEVMTRSEVDDATPIANAVARCSEAVPFLRGIHEKRIDWMYCGRAARSTLDVRGVDFVTDLKTTRCSEPWKFAWDALKRQYHAQLAFYRQAAGMPSAPCYIVAVENVAPYCVTVMQIEEPALIAGEMQCRAWFERLLICEAANDWPGYVRGVQMLSLPERDDVELTFGDEEEEAAQ
jgi:hypothetical protein